ncbi:alkaline shock response membrane anchor protein AmaP [Streptomyces albulus]|uniref:alkaline shock response membrane anchor protein AmaP n=1 Tax=Streptomyces noursei TaxID=1971 RepID=UPI001F2C5561|nr:alkaline shock response membrane anchor protein AmaP [Streptomyces noursei]MCE4941546.1 alkaline shock response membrane anchor protein AmaP [Streptomyces noursei]
MPHIRNVVNRTLLGLLATAVVAGGLWAVATHSALRDRLPDGWAAATSPAHLLDGGVPSPGGVPWTTVLLAASAMATVLCLAWCAWQFRSAQARRLPLRQAGVSLRTRALSEVLGEQTAAVTGVARAHVRMTARKDRLHARVRLRLVPDAQPSRVLDEFARTVLAPARHAARPRRLTAHVHLDRSAHRPRRLR